MDESGYAAGELVCTVSPEARRNIAQGAKPSWGRAGGLSGRWPSLLRPRIVRRRSFRFARPPHAPGLELVHYPSLTRGWREIPEVYTWFTIANPMIFSRAPAVMHGGSLHGGGGQAGSAGTALKIQIETVGGANRAVDADGVSQYVPAAAEYEAPLPDAC